MYNTVIVINIEKSNYVKEWRHRLNLSVIILQYMRASNHLIGHLNLIYVKC